MLGLRVSSLHLFHFPTQWSNQFRAHLLQANHAPPCCPGCFQSQCSLSFCLSDSHLCNPPLCHLHLILERKKSSSKSLSQQVSRLLGVLSYFLPMWCLLYCVASLECNNQISVYSNSVFDLSLLNWLHTQHIEMGQQKRLITVGKKTH